MNEKNFTPTDDQGLTVWQRLDACDRAILQLASQVSELSHNLFELRNELSIVTSMQRSITDMDTRLGEFKSQLTEMLSKLTERTITGSRIYPSKIPVDSPAFGTAKELESRLAEEFDCREGDPRYCHTAILDGAEIQYPYRVLGLIAPTWVKEKPEEHLRQAVWCCLLRLKRETKQAKPILYWRRHVEEHNEPGKGHKISLRIAIPALTASGWAYAYGMLVVDGEPYPIIGV